MLRNEEVCYSKDIRFQGHRMWWKKSVLRQCHRKGRCLACVFELPRVETIRICGESLDQGTRRVVDLNRDAWNRITRARTDDETSDARIFLEDVNVVSCLAVC